MLLCPPAFGKTGAPGLSAISGIASATSVAATVTTPGSINAGDLLVLFDLASGITAPADVVPPGYTGIFTVTVGSYRLRVSNKIASGSEGGATVTGMSGAAQNWKILPQYRGNLAIGSVSWVWPTPQIVSGNPSAETIAASAGVQPVLAFGFYCNVTGTAASRSSGIAQDNEYVRANGSGETAYLRDFIRPSGDFLIDMGAEEGTANVLAGLYGSLSV